ncbi:hypothetical protein [Yinghuangia sp. YIM S09857]|uniref:hypothetical protein n=1 Tax=Yinghuangia sp. YIM S09857 TaxID=3436929 RepID=UPI003F532393
MTFLVAIRPAREASSAPKAVSPCTRRRLDLAATAGPTVFLAAMGWNRRWMADDGLILTRVVRQVVAGNGPVYNVGERVETSTGTAWQWLLVAVHSQMHGLLIAARADERHVLMLDPRYGEVFGLAPDFAPPLRPDLENRVAPVTGKMGAGGAMMPLDGLLADVWGLSSTIGAHLDQTNFAAAGHQKLMPPAWNIALYVDPAAFPSVPPALADPEQVQVAHRVLVCGDVRELPESVTEPMDFDRFGKNLTCSYQRTSIRIPVNAVEAVRKFCA